MAEQIRHQCSHLGSLVDQIAANAPYPVYTFFSCMYNIFGMVHSSIMHTGSNNVQTLLYLLNNPSRQLVVPYHADEDIFGTDVEDSVTRLLERTDNSAGNAPLQFLPVNSPVKAGSLINAVKQSFPDRHRYVKFSEGRKPGLTEVGLTEVKGAIWRGDYAGPIQDRIMYYLHQS
jgi:hypothetical protein